MYVMGHVELALCIGLNVVVERFIGFDPKPSGVV